MSAQSIAQLAPQLQDIDVTANDQIETTSLELASLNDAHEQTGVDQVHADYGFDGSGQTVAIIDSGIAWDHYALGGGYGENARVVGGWDFAENDANPYDDGPAGFHGTHVSGIVGSGHEDHPGVASGVDLVGLRVFDDAGNGSLEWVEQALQWVHEHKDDFENPITTVNLSIGSDWNSTEVPDWGILEDELAQLELDGMFVSVAAGNSFTDYFATGLSYPAASPHVVPVASHDAEGMISDDSQRASNVLVAPGENIKSSVPDHLFGGTSSDRFIATSGTSMAAPYVAGASTLLRQANEFMGIENINQEMLYEQFMESADQVYDSATGGYYHNINVQAAIDAVVADLHSGGWMLATDAGTLVDGSVIEGTIGKETDTDTFSFVAETNGQVILNFETTHDLHASVVIQGQSLDYNNNQVAINVVAGQEYKFKVGSDSGIGHYKITVEQSTVNVNAANWGMTSSKTFLNEQVSGQKWYQLTAANDGVLTFQAASSNLGENFRLEVYDANMNELSTGGTTNGVLRSDVQVQQGDLIYVKAIAESATVDFQVTNLVSIRSGEVVVNGTAGNDVVNVTEGNALLIDVNGVGYQFDINNVSKVTAVGNGGSDTIDVTLGDGDESVTLKEGVAYSVRERFEMFASGFANVDIDAGGGQNLLALIGSEGNDVFLNDGQEVTISGANYTNVATGFSKVAAYGNGGNDQARLVGSEVQDDFTSNDGFDMLRSQGNSFIAVGFEHVVVDGAGGQDTATLFDTEATDEFVTMPEYASIVTSEYTVAVNDFERLNAVSRSGNDTLEMRDSHGNDNFVQNGNFTTMTGDGFIHFAKGFTEVTAIARGGNDTASVFDTAGNDTLYSDGDQTILSGTSRTTTTRGFDMVNTIAVNGGNDTANIFGTSGSDAVTADVGSVSITDSSLRSRYTYGFDTVNVDTRGGQDLSLLRGSAGQDVLNVDRELVEFRTVLQEVRMKGMDNTHFDGNGGTDEVNFSDFEELDLLTAVGDRAIAYLNNNRVVAEDFSILEAETSRGHFSNHGIDEVDYLFMLRGNWNSL